MSWLTRIVNVVRSHRVEDELDEELTFHVEEKARRLVAEGVAPDDAAREANRRLGNATVLRERSRDVRLLPWLDALVRDAQFGFRMLRKESIVSGAAIASLALAMGASIAAFGLVDALILRPLAVRDPASLVYLTYPPVNDNGVGSRENSSFSHPAVLRLRRAGQGRVALFGVSYQSMRPLFDGPGDGEKVHAQYLTGDAFGELGLAPSLGRLLSPADDDKAGAHPVAVLSHGFWTTHFGGDRAVIGRWVTLERTPLQIVGVAGDSFTGLEPGVRTDLWVPMTMFRADALTSSGFQWLRIMGRLAPGVSSEEARVLLQPAFTNYLRDRIGPPRADDVPGQRERYLQRPIYVRSAANGPSFLRLAFERPLWILAIVVGLVLLIACSNVANLLTARAAAREREMALRMSIGAGRARLVQQMLIESTLMASVACVLGLLLAAITAPIIVSLLGPREEPVFLELHASWRMIVFIAVAVVTSSLVFGLMPALRASSSSPMIAMKMGGGAGRSGTGLLRAVISAQVAFSLAVLFTAGLLVLSFARLDRVDTGFTRSGITLATIESDALGDLEHQEPATVRSLAAQLLERLRGMPGVKGASLSAWPLFAGGEWTTTVHVPGRDPDGVEVHYLEISPRFMQTMGIRVLEGRELDARDAEPDKPSAVLVNAAFARHYFSDGHPVGREFGRPDEGNTLQPQEIVGLVADAKYNDLREPAPPTVYVPLRGLNRKTLEVRSTVDSAALAEQMRAKMARVHPAIRMSSVTDQSTLIDDTLLKERLLALLSGFFAVVSLLLAAVGLYGVLTYSVVQRTREIGIRMALGARQAAVVRAVVTDLAVVTGAGLFIGLAGGIALARFVRTLLFEITPYDLTSLTLPLAMLTAVAIAAAVPPALRAARIDPTEALRYE